MPLVPPNTGRKSRTYVNPEVYERRLTLFIPHPHPSPAIAPVVPSLSVTYRFLIPESSGIDGKSIDEETEVYRQFPKVYEVYQIYQSLSPSVYFWVHVLSEKIHGLNIPLQHITPSPDSEKEDEQRPAKHASRIYRERPVSNEQSYICGGGCESGSASPKILGMGREHVWSLWASASLYRAYCHIGGAGAELGLRWAIDQS
ncbi:hypothetical protein C8J57DRAFT_1229254 [Mycena rebaudengoi]|nr:hypothetical protein C8J57DRAFT_1229254 [Mycena rebaudengoi]